MSQSKNQNDLFSRFPITKWLPNETLFSLCSRYHLLSGHRLASTTCKRLFKHSYLGCQHDFPAKVDQFVKSTCLELGTSESIIRNHTLTPYYFPFRDKACALDSITALKLGSLGSIKFRLGILTSRFRANHPLKACSACIAADKEKYAVPYWHLDHQLPGAWICLEHNSILKESIVKSNGVERFNWLLPNEQKLTSGLGLSREDKVLDNYIPQITELAIASIGLHSLPEGFHFNQSRMKTLVTRELRRKGLCSKNGRLFHDKISTSYLEYVKPFREFREMTELPSNKQEAQTQLVPILYFTRRKGHPIRLLTAILWLFESWDLFIEAYNTERNIELPCYQATDKETENKKNRISEKSALLKMIEDGTAITTAARQLGIDASTALCWASQEGFSVPRRPKKLDPKVQKEVINSLLDGQSKQHIANTYNVSITTINRILRSDFNLSQIWTELQTRRKRHEHRTNWLSAIHLVGAEGVKAVRQHTPATYAWLYRNDRTWLVETNNSIPFARHGNNASTDWACRDQELSILVLKECSKLSSCGQPITLQSIYQCLPELRAKLSALNKLPLTKKVISKYTQGVSDTETPTQQLELKPSPNSDL